ncbi:UTRA domain-containing protein [Streptomyces sp. NPDC050085]|uniref:UTRA domain-containing protein n=1 Tax=Streptomyces sp. NPDC050085 TaxID=3365600 RepID=UPI0037AF536D
MAVNDASPIVLPDTDPLAGQPVTTRMARIGITVTHRSEILEQVTLDRDEAARVSAPVGSLAIRLTRVHYTDSNRAVETADFLLPAAHWTIAYHHKHPAEIARTPYSSP